MKVTTTFTSTMSPELMQWVDGVAKAKKLTRRSVLEEAIRTYKHKVVSEKLRKDFESIANDPDIVEMAEWGMEDYARMLKDFDA